MQFSSPSYLCCEYKCSQFLSLRGISRKCWVFGRPNSFMLHSMLKASTKWCIVHIYFPFKIGALSGGRYRGNFAVPHNSCYSTYCTILPFDHFCWPPKLSITIWYCISSSSLQNKRRNKICVVAQCQHKKTVVSIGNSPSSHEMQNQYNQVSLFPCCAQIFLLECIKLTCM